MTKPKKSTKRFKQKHLQKELANRRLYKKIKKSKEKRKRATLDEDDQENNLKIDPETGDKALEEQSVDEFLEGGFARELQAELEASEEEDEEEAEDFDRDLLADPEVAGDDDEEALDGDESAGMGEEVYAEEGEEEEEEGDEKEEEEGEEYLKLEVERHRRQLEELKRRDPDFVKHLEQNEPELLRFGEEEEGKEEAGEAEEERSDAAAQAEAPRARQLTEETLARLIRSAQSGLPPLKRLVLAFRAAAHVADEDPASGGDFRYAIANSRVFNRLIVFCLKNMDRLFDHYLGRKPAAAEEGESAAGGTGERKRGSVTGLARWKKAENVVKSYVGNLLHLLRNLVEPRMTAFVLHHLLRLIPYLAPFPRIARLFLKHLIHLWTSAEEAVRLLAFLNIREMALSIPFPFIELCLKHTYVAFVRNAAFTSAKTLPTINFLLNGVVEMYMLDTGLAYQHAFVYIRELAIELRKALHQKGEEAARRVRSWAFFHSLRFFVRLLSTAQAQQGSELVLLVYPLMQLLEGAASLAKGAALLPLRLHLLELELELAEASGQHASVVPWLLEALDSAELRHRPRLLKAGESSRALDLSLVLRASKGQLRTRAFQEALFDFVLDLLYHQYAQVSCSIAFPEFVLPVVSHLRRWSRETPSPQHRKQVVQLVEKLEAQSEWVLRQRNKVEFAPSDVEKAAAFLAAERQANKSPLALFYQERRNRRLTQLQQQQQHQPQQNQKHEGDQEEEEEGEDKSGGEDQSDQSSERSQAETAEQARRKRPGPANRENRQQSTKRPKKVREATQRLDAHPSPEEDVVQDFTLSDSESE